MHIHCSALNGTVMRTLIPGLSADCSRRVLNNSTGRWTACMKTKLARLELMTSFQFCIIHFDCAKNNHAYDLHDDCVITSRCDRVTPGRDRPIHLEVIRPWFQPATSSWRAVYDVSRRLCCWLQARHWSCGNAVNLLTFADNWTVRNVRSDGVIVDAHSGVVCNITAPWSQQSGKCEQNTWIILVLFKIDEFDAHWFFAKYSFQGNWRPIYYQSNVAILCSILLQLFHTVWII